ncbi:MAG: glycosyltransferase [Bifidobacterium criceti]|nr:glycosyltransferase [Bifidobacterium criceti]
MSGTGKPSVLVSEISGNWGGIEAFIENEVTPLQDEFDVYCIAQNDDPAIRARLTIPDDHVLTVSERYGSLAYRRHMRQIYGHGFDIIHLNKNSLVKYLPLTLARKVSPRSKYILHSHNTSPSSKSPLAFLHYLTRPFAVRHAQCLLACSQTAASYLFGSRAQNATIVRNGIDVPRFTFDERKRIEVREAWHIPTDATVLVNVARLSDQKNQMRLVEMFDEYRKGDPSAFLLLVGEGERRPQIEKIIARRGLERHVRLTGRQQDIGAYYSAADLAVFPSLFEGLPVAFIEAQANGIPILASDVVTKDADVLGTMCFESLSASDAVWADHIAALSVSGRALDADLRRSAAERMEQAGYDAKNASETLRRIYRRLLAS